MITEGKRAKLPLGAFGLPERHCYPIFDEASAGQAFEDATADYTARTISKAQFARVNGAVERFRRRLGRKKV